MNYSIFCELNNLLIYENTVLKNIFISRNVNNLKSNCKPLKIQILSPYHVLNMMNNICQDV